jgi:hypothetical protein
VIYLMLRADIVIFTTMIMETLRMYKHMSPWNWGYVCIYLYGSFLRLHTR